MDINDFNGNFKYKLIIPFFFVLSWVFMFLGPAFFQVQYQMYCVGLVLYLCLRTTIMFVCAIVAFFKSLGMFCRFDKLRNNNPDPVGMQTQLLKKQILHAYIIPNYKEDQDLLIETIEKIAEHPWAKNRSMVFLGMEAHEPEGKEKADKISKIFRNKFRLFGYTIHQMREYEQKGKASNVSWCVQHLQQQFFVPNNISIDNVMLTIIDTDSWIPEMYVHELQDHLTKPENYSKKHKFIYQPNQIFTRNHLDVPIFTRCYDQFYACMHHSNTMVSMFDAGFPLSNYSLSYSLIKKIGFWDTVPDAIGQDFHTTMKAFWKTEGEAYTVPIFTPFNQINIQTGKSYFADMEARFWQSQRHSRGVADVAYNINMLIKQPFKFRTFIIALNCIEIFFLPSTVPWALFAMTLQSQILFKYIKRSPQLISDDYIGYCFQYATLLFWIVYGMYYYIKRRATTQFYKLENESFLRVIEYPLLFLFNMITISLPTMVIAVFGVLFDNREYIVAQKVLNKKNNRERHHEQYLKDEIS